MEKYIFIIAGKARHGKTTVANFIKEYYEVMNKKLIITGFSKYIKMYAREILDWNGEDDTKPRKFLQSVGNELRSIDENFLADRLIDDMDVYKHYGADVAIDDARLSHEIDYIKSSREFVKVINVVRPDFDNGLSEDEKNDITEVDLDDYKNYDYTIVNDGSLDDLKNKVISILEGLDI